MPVASDNVATCPSVMDTLSIIAVHVLYIRVLYNLFCTLLYAHTSAAAAGDRANELLRALPKA